jgi:glycosyltransferase involved in cell wall biosynthesis
VQPADAEALAEAMIGLARSPERRAELGVNARRGAGELTVDAVAARLTRTYQVLSDPTAWPSAPAVGTN